ncbi:hypothetical protein CsatB_026407 [Cannabis sativa]
MTSINISSYWFEDDPFLLANQVNLVFYLDDIKKGENWKVVQKVNHRHIWEILSEPEVDDGERVVQNREAYQEDSSNNINLTLDSSNNMDGVLIRKDIDEVETDELLIDSPKDQNNQVQHELNIDDIDEEALLSGSDSETDCDESD